MTTTSAESARQKRLYLELADSLQAVSQTSGKLAKDREAPA
jgi:hypothetical protein